MKVFRIAIVLFYVIRCPVVVYRLTATVLELARVNGAGVTTYASEPSTKHPAVAKPSFQNFRGLPVAITDLRLALTDKRIGISEVDPAPRFDSRQIPPRSPPLFS